MANVTLVHCIYPHKVPARDLPRVVADIRTHQRLAAGYGYHGYGVYAFMAGRVPTRSQIAPAVVFEVEETMVEEVGPKGSEFAFIRVPFGQWYLPIAVIRFVNVP